MATSKFIIYQVLPRLFGNDCENCVKNGTLQENGCGKFDDFTPLALKKIKDKGFTHVWYTGIIEHATKTEHGNLPATHPAIVKGMAGSPYAITDYYDVAADLATDSKRRMQEFESLVQRTHDCGLKVIIDFVPNHVSRQYRSDVKPAGVKDLGEGDDVTKSFSQYNNFYYIPGARLQGSFDMIAGAAAPYEEIPAKVTGNDCFNQYPSHCDWFETVKLNYGVDYMNGGTRYFNPVPDTWHKMLDILEFWASKGIDGFRCDMAEMVPVEFWAWAIKKIKQKHEQIIFIAEVYAPSLYEAYAKQGGFDYLYDKVGLYDTLRAVVMQTRPASDITHAWQSLGTLHGRMLNFLENHDEQRIASEFFAKDPFKAIPALAVSALMNVNPFMAYFGQEYGEQGMDEEGYSGRDGKTTIFDYWSLDTIRRWRNGGKYDGKALTRRERELCSTYAHILKIARAEQAISQGKFFDLTYANLDNTAYDAAKLFSFVRGTGNEFIFISANFSSEGQNAEVNLPQHLFDYFGINPAVVEATDLIANKIQVMPFSPKAKMKVSLEPHGTKILKFRIRK